MVVNKHMIIILTVTMTVLKTVPPAMITIITIYKQQLSSPLLFYWCHYYHSCYGKYQRCYVFTVVIITISVSIIVVLIMMISIIRLILLIIAIAIILLAMMMR